MILYIFFPFFIQDKLQHDILKIAQEHVTQAKSVVAKDVGRFVGVSTYHNCFFFYLKLIWRIFLNSIFKNVQSI